MRIELTGNFIATTLRFSEKFDRTFPRGFLYVVTFGPLYKWTNKILKHAKIDDRNSLKI